MSYWKNLEEIRCDGKPLLGIHHPNPRMFRWHVYGYGPGRENGISWPHTWVRRIGDRPTWDTRIECEMTIDVDGLTREQCADFEKYALNTVRLELELLDPNGMSCNKKIETIDYYTGLPVIEAWSLDIKQCTWFSSEDSNESTPAETLKCVSMRFVYQTIEWKNYSIPPLSGLE